MATIKKVSKAKNLSAGPSKKTPKAGPIDPKGKWTKVQERTLGSMKKGGKIKKAQDGTQFGKYNIDTTGYAAGKKVFPYTAPNPRTNVSKKSEPATRTGKMGRADLEKIMKWEKKKSSKK